MIQFLFIVLLVALATTAIVSTIVVTLRDGYRRIPAHPRH